MVVEEILWLHLPVIFLIIIHRPPNPIIPNYPLIQMTKNKQNRMPPDLNGKVGLVAFLARF